MKTFPKLLFIFLLLSFTTYCQNLELSSLLIAPELREKANAVVRDNTMEITIENVNRMIVSERKVITILNKSGDRYSQIYQNYDNDTKITKLSAKIYDAFGKEIKKFKSRDFQDVSAVDGGTLYSDSRVKYADYTPISYPYTLVLESEYKTSTTGFIPSWFPVSGYYVSVEKSNYKINNPKAIQWRTKEYNLKGFDIQKSITNTQIVYVLENQPAMEYESGTLPSIDLLPHIKVGLNKFSVKGFYGEASNWSDLGKWEYEVLYKDEDNISEETLTKINLLTEGIDDPVDKAKKIYEFVQDKTRYINVSIGIGGLRPIKSEIVDKVGYGDCKGLTNYTRALLKKVGIESFFAEIYAGNSKRNMDFDFPTIHGNHVILNIPNEGNDIWLECTSQTTPFGFLGDFTDDRDVLVITPNGAIKKRTPAYKNETNLQTISGEIELSAKGNIKANIKRVSKGIQYDDKAHYDRYTKEELIKNYKSNVWDYNNNLEVLNVKLNNDKENIIFTEDLNLSIKDYAIINDTEYLFRVSVFNRGSYVPKRYRTRKLPLKISRGYRDEDNYTFKIPLTYKIDYLPEEREINSKFGSYKISFQKIDDTSFKYNKTILIKEGIYPKEDYKNYRSFRRKIAKSENLRIAIIKK